MPINSSPLLDLLQREVQAGLPNLRGARIDGIIPVRKNVLDELCTYIKGVKITLQAEDGDVLTVRAAALPIPVRLQMEQPLPGLALRFRVMKYKVFGVPVASPLPALLGLVGRFVQIPAAVHIAGDEITVALAELPELAAWRFLFRYLDLQLHANAGMLSITWKLVLP